ncbi:hypothetical protein CLOSTMETH_01024 [[Clostridium] methylpentosum DSM 5476]|uniref:Uncharacterized protein n=1 Tax=[Clostridium] methylpentosum DSM 5476 TaxID=537013 RepID=C0EB07_9FIRM|nr:hypothetical protein CLOSTMETH_01024 [[Clostridium] methylpentosum DSM 5476]
MVFVDLMSLIIVFLILEALKELIKYIKSKRPSLPQVMVA